MKKFNIYNKSSGADFGIYEGDTASDALDALARDIGYADYAEACAVTDTTIDDDEIGVDEVDE